MRKLIKPIALTAIAGSLLTVAFPAMAFAEEAAAHADNTREGIELLIPVLGEFVPMAIAFIVLWVILAKVGWPAFMGMIDKRANTIKESLERAENAKIESERILEENRAELADAKKQAAQIVADAKQAAAQVRTELEDQARADAEQIITKARAAVEAEKKAAIAELQSSVADLSVAVAGRLIGTELSDAEHRKVIERYLAEAGSLNAN
jgi:F-type H+-transporting ATPase subunit b